MFAGVVLLGVAGTRSYLHSASLKVSSQVAGNYSPAPAAASPPVHVTVGSLIDIDVEPHGYNNGKWTVAAERGSYLVQSAKPGEAGNVIIYGHNKQSIFGKLTQVNIGETITVRTATGVTRRYRTVSRQEVSPSQTDVLAPTNQEVLTLYTCSGFLDSKRFIVRAEPQP